MGTSLEAMGIHIQTGDSRKKRVGGFRITGGDEPQPRCQPWGRGLCSLHRVAVFPSPSQAVSVQSHKDTDGTVSLKDGQ